MTTQSALAIPSDPGLPGVRGLFGTEATSMLGSFLERRGWSLDEARPVQAMYRPGRSCLVRYRVRAEGPAGPRVLMLCAETSSTPMRLTEPPDDFERRTGLPEPVEQTSGAAVWAYPYDPSLGDLPDAAWSPSVREQMRTGFGDASAVSIQPLRYRPRRRAVFRYRSLHRTRRGREWRTSYGKVIPSRKADRVVRASAGVGAAGIPVQAPVRFGRQLIITPQLEGTSLRDLLVRGGSLPDPRRLSRIVTRLADGGSGVTWTRPSSVQQVRSAAGLIDALLPERHAEVTRVVEAVNAGPPGDGSHLVHGDLYEAQVMVGRGFSLGLIDLDDVALGDPLMDAANASAHLLVLALAVPRSSARLLAYRELTRSAILRDLGATSAALAWREALCVLQLASGPFRVLDPRWPYEVGRRVDLAVRLLTGA